MATDRIKQLEKYCEEDPEDAFNIYALALEYLRSDKKKSASLFEKLLQDHKEYLPVYYHAAGLYHDMGEKEKAVATYESGILLARQLKDTKTMRELQSAYDEMMFE